MRSSVLRAVLGAATILCVAVPPAGAGVGPDYVSSDNIELVNRIKTVGDGVGGRIVGDYLYVTSTKSLSIFDIKTNPESPALVGQMQIDVEWENEEVPTNGKILGMSAEIGCKDPLGVLAGQPAPPDDVEGATHCINLYDVSNKQSVTFLKSVVGAGNHTSACVLDCSYMWGDNGPITDIRNPKAAEIVGNWKQAAKIGNANCHAVREVADGIVFGACTPIVLLSTRAEHGGSPLKPVVIAQARNNADYLIHSNRWPRLAQDRFALIGGERNAEPQCDDTVSAFMVWDATGALNGKGGWKMGGTFTKLDEIRPSNGTYADGKSPYNVLGCSVHWFTEHPEFRNGGAVALAEYENGTRLLQVTPAGKIIEQGYFLPLGGSTSAPHFHPNGKVIYAIDYTRGIDVLRYTGPSYRGGEDPFNPGTPQIEPGTTPGTNGRRNEPAIAAQQQRERQFERDCSLIALAASAKGTGRGLTVSAGGAAFEAQVFQLSRGSRILTKRRVGRLSAGSGEATWNGRTPRGKAVPNGFYLVRVTTGGKTRQLVFQRRGGRFVARPDFQTGSSCDVLRSLQVRSPVFGGRKNVAAAVSFRLTQNMTTVRIDALRGKKVVRRVTRREAVAGRTYKVAIPARGLKKGTYTIRITGIRGGRPVTIAAVTAQKL
jgi:hypothetical protein